MWHLSFALILTIAGSGDYPDMPKDYCKRHPDGYGCKKVPKKPTPKSTSDSPSPTPFR